MVDFNLSANMSLPIPVTGIAPGPEWANLLNACQTLLDSHDHSPGKGVQVTPAGLNISSDLNFFNNNAYNLKSTRFSVQGSNLSSGADIGCLYVAGVDLFYNDVNGNQIRMTNNGSIAGTNGSISGLVSPASASYSSVSKTFVWQSDVNKPANLDAASVILRELVTGAKGVTLKSSTSLVSDYQLTMPLLPTGPSVMTLDTSGTMGTIAQNRALDTEEHVWVLNGNYGALPTYPQTDIDLVFIAPYDLTITNIWIYNGVAGASGTTEFDIKKASSGGSFTSILSTTGKIDSTAASGVWTDAGSIIAPQTGVTKPVISSATMTAGQALRWDLIQAMTGAAADAKIIINFRPT